MAEKKEKKPTDRVTVTGDKCMVDDETGEVVASRVTGKGSHPNTLKNLKIITPNNANKYREAGLQVRLENSQLREDFKRNIKAIKALKSDLPDITALDVLRVSMHMALQKENYEDAARYAGMIAEYEQPKLQRIDQKITNSVEDMTDDELREAVRDEGLPLQ